MCQLLVSVACLNSLLTTVSKLTFLRIHIEYIVKFVLVFLVCLPGWCMPSNRMIALKWRQLKYTGTILVFVSEVILI